jgi:solute carrier family 8 (sodium/calcium exchanger)
LHEDLKLGVRTVEDSALEGKDFVKIDKEIIIPSGQNSMDFNVFLINDNDYEPDKEFQVELYDFFDTKSKERLPGGDTSTKITIIDDEMPGYVGFEETNISVRRNAEHVDIVLNRMRGSDGDISVQIITEEIMNTFNMGLDKFDFKALTDEIVTFKAGETIKQISIPIIDLDQTNDDERLMSRQQRNNAI